MSDKRIEKTFLYFLILSFVLHVAAITCFIIILKQQKKREAGQEAYMVELSDFLPKKEAPRVDEKIMRYPGKTHRIIRQESPKSTGESDSDSDNHRSSQGPPYADAVKPRDRKLGKPVPMRQPSIPGRSHPNGMVANPKGKAFPALSKLYPSADKMRSLADSYRKKYHERIGGDTIFWGDDDPIMGSFSRRFEDALRDRWMQVGEPITRSGNFGYGLVLITVNRDGQVVSVTLIETSGNHMVDEGLIRAVKTAGYFGPLPKKWPYDVVHGYFLYTAGPYKINY